jgi:glutamate-1-semialdehyde 2,1-aminomutase
VSVQNPHDWLVCRCNDSLAVKAIIESHGSEIDAVLVNPTQGSGGSIAGCPDFQPRLPRHCGDHCSLLTFEQIGYVGVLVSGRVQRKVKR